MGSCGSKDKPSDDAQGGHSKPQPQVKKGDAAGADDGAFARALGGELLRQDRTVVPGADLAGKTVAVYFSAHWCPPCRKFTPVLKEFYEEYKQLDPNFEIIFVSWDKTESAFWDYFSSHGPYLAVPFKGKAADDLQKRVKVSGIPTLAVFSPAGKLLTSMGREKVTRLRAAGVHRDGWSGGCGGR